MVQNSPTFKKLYQKIWTGLRVTIFYTARRELHVCILYGKDARFFLTLRECIAWANRQGLILNADKALKEAGAEADYLERLDDLFTDEADERHRLNQYAAQVDDTGELARLLSRWKDRRWIRW